LLARRRAQLQLAGWVLFASAIVTAVVVGWVVANGPERRADARLQKLANDSLIVAPPTGWKRLSQQQSRRRLEGEREYDVSLHTFFSAPTNIAAPDQLLIEWEPVFTKNGWKLLSECEGLGPYQNDDGTVISFTFGRDLLVGTITVHSSDPNRVALSTSYTKRAGGCSGLNGRNLPSEQP
jgi:hypothetical protein